MDEDINDKLSLSRYNVVESAFCEPSVRFNRLYAKISGNYHPINKEWASLYHRAIRLSGGSAGTSLMLYTL